MRQYRVAKQLGLAGAVIAPDFQHDVRATRVAVFLDASDAFFRRPGNRTNFMQNLVSHSISSGLTPASFHGVSDGPQLVEGQARRLEKHVGRALDVLYLVGEVHRRLLARAFFALRRIAVDASNDDGPEHELRWIFSRLARPFFHVLARVAHKRWRSNARGEQSISDDAGTSLQHRTSARNVDRRNTPRSMRVWPERWHVRLKGFSLILERVASEQTLDDLDALPHHGSRTNLLAFTFTNFFHENLGRSQTKQKAIASQILHDPRLHRDLYRMTCVG